MAMSAMPGGSPGRSSPLARSIPPPSVMVCTVPLQLGEALVTRRKTFRAIRIEINDELVILEMRSARRSTFCPDGACAVAYPRRD